MDAISITGLQATGKTTLARALGHALDAVVFSRDPLMDVLLAGGVPMAAETAGANTNYIADSVRPHEDNVRSIVQLIKHRAVEA